MLRNYFKTAIRTLLKHRGFSFINVSGLAIGISTCTLISLYVLDELSYNTFHEKANRIYRLEPFIHLPKETRPSASAPPMAPALKDNFPEVLKTVRLSSASGTLTYQTNKFYDTRIWYADSTLFDIFTFPMLKGNPSKALVEPYSIVLTEKAAKKYFGEEDPLGKSMVFSDTIGLTVTGVIQDIPSNSHIQFDVVLSRVTLNAIANYRPENNWFYNGFYTYLLLPDNYDYKNLEAKFPAFLEKQQAEMKKRTGLWFDFTLRPLTDIHLRSNLPFEIVPGGNIKYVYTFSIVAVLVLLIACANYINLSTAKSAYRIKELGLRKVVGAGRTQLILQLLSESFVLMFAAFVIALAIVSIALPAFSTLANKTMDINFLLKPEVMLTSIGIFLLIGLLAATYPAMLMSAFSPIQAIKNYVRTGRENNLLRKGLVVFQFTISIILIAGTILIYRQMSFLQNQNLGFSKEQVIELFMRNTITSHHQLMKEEMLKVPGVQMASVTDFSYREGVSNVALLPEGAGENEISSEAAIAVDYDFIPTFNIQLIAGRNFSKEFTTDSSEAFIVNEAAVKQFNWGTPETAIGKTLNWGLGKQGKVVGVVRDFNFSSLHEKVRPLILHIYPDWYSLVALKISGNNISETMTHMEERWSELNPDSAFDYSFLDKDFENLYRAEQQTKTIIGLFSGLAIFIACLGLFGLAAFTAEQRTKEIGIRKVLGASVLGITQMLSKDFAKLMAIAIVLSVPLARYLMSRWLESFAYRTEISWWIFGTAGLSAIIIALFTVSFQSIKAALANPVDSLRNE